MELDDFLVMNPAGARQKVSKVLHLIRIGATNEEFLAAAAELMDTETPSIACFAQLPYSLVTHETIMVRPGTTRIFELHFYPATLQIQDDGSQALHTTPLKSDSSGGFEVTQVIGFLKYWGIRRRWYEAYEGRITPTGAKGGHFVRTEDSWLERHEPIGAELFENDIARRLLEDFMHATRRGLPMAFSQHYGRLLNYFVMPCKGRVAFGSVPVPTIRHLLIRQPARELSMEDHANIETQSVFLSYGGPDERVAMALRADLAQRGVDTWWFPENAQWGERIHVEVRRNIQKYDRLLLLCSKRSLIRAGVLHEIEEALEREASEGGRAILLPVALDDVLATEWWRFSPSATGESVLGNFNPVELKRRRELALALQHRVVGDLRDASPEDRKWQHAVSRLVKSLAPAARSSE